MASLAHPGIACDGLRPTFGGAAPAVAYFLIQHITGKPPNFGGEGDPWPSSALIPMS
mgnify:CR=1 FL=1